MIALRPWPGNVRPLTRTQATLNDRSASQQTVTDQQVQAMRLISGCLIGDFRQKLAKYPIKCRDPLRYLPLKLFYTEPYLLQFLLEGLNQR